MRIGVFPRENYLYGKTQVFRLRRLYAICPEIVNKGSINFYEIYEEKIKCILIIYVGVAELRYEFI